MRKKQVKIFHTVDMLRSSKIDVPPFISSANCTKSWQSFVRVRTLIQSTFGFNTRNRLTARLHKALRAVVELMVALN